MKDQSHVRGLTDLLAGQGVSLDQLPQLGIDLKTLEAIRDSHSRSQEDLRAAAHHTTKSLESLPEVHSLKVRIKDPDHLVSKLIRRRRENAEFPVAVETYQSDVTDLIGVRALHLFKHQWRAIHEFTMKTWDTEEKPIAYYRDGDPEKTLEDFRQAGCTVCAHPMGYRSVHYVIKTKPTKAKYLIELQVRTLFEEGWAEIDHLVRYPDISDNLLLAGFLAVLNRLSGSADEMGSHIGELGKFIHDQEAEASTRDRQLLEAEARLEHAVSELEIGAKEKAELRGQIRDLKKRFQAAASSPVFPTFIGEQSLSIGLVGAPQAVAPSVLTSIVKCTKCGQSFQSVSPFSLILSQLCSRCRTGPAQSPFVGML